MSGLVIKLSATNILIIALLLAVIVVTAFLLYRYMKNDHDNKK